MKKMYYAKIGLKLVINPLSIFLFRFKTGFSFLIFLNTPVKSSVFLLVEINKYPLDEPEFSFVTAVIPRVSGIDFPFLNCFVPLYIYKGNKKALISQRRKFVTFVNNLDIGKFNK